MAIKNPLRYPGAKSKLFDYIYNLLQVEGKLGCVFYEPFAGSAAISLMLLEKKAIKKAVINELDPLLYNFWVSVFNHTDELIKLIEETEISLDNWYHFSSYRDSNNLTGKTAVEIGFAGLFLNRTNFSGILKANPLGGLGQTSNYKIDCRFNKSKIIESIKDLSKLGDKIEIHNMDAIEFMKTQLRYKRNSKIFVYIDPPYYNEGQSLYRFFYTDKQHIELAKYIKTKTFPWLISYDDVAFIRQLYKRLGPICIYMDYSAYTSKRGEELLISNLEIPPLVEETQLVNDLIS